MMEWVSLVSDIISRRKHCGNGLIGSYHCFKAFKTIYLWRGVYSQNQSLRPSFHVVRPRKMERMVDVIINGGRCDWAEDTQRGGWNLFSKPRRRRTRYFLSNAQLDCIEYVQ